MLAFARITEAAVPLLIYPREDMMNRYYSVFLTVVPLTLAGAANATDADPGTAATAPPEEIVIQTSRDKGDYRVDILDSVGPLGSTPIIDVPYSISVLPSDLIENTQAVDFKEVS